MEILTVEEFAQKMKVGRTTVFQWIKEDVLIQGKHFFKVGRIIRFQWPDVLELLQGEKQAEKQEISPPKIRKKSHQDSPINFQYR